MHPARHGVRELNLPVAVLALARVPLDVLASPRPREPFGHDLAQARPRASVTATANRCPLRLLGAELPLGQNRALEPADSIDWQARRVGDLLGGLACADPVLDLLRSQQIG